MLMQGLTYVVPLFVWPYLMRVLGAEKFGYIGFGLALNQYLMILVDFGFNLSATKRIALAKDNQDEINRVFSQTVSAKMLLLGVSALLLLCVSCIPQYEVYRPTLYLLFSMVVGQVFTFVWLFQGLGKIRVVTIVNSLTKLVLLPLTFWLVKSEEHYLRAALLQAVVYVVAALLSDVMMWRMRLARLVRVRWSGVKAALRDSFPLFLSQAASSVYAMLFVVILGYVALPEEVGRYAASEKLMRISCVLVFTPLVQAFFPRITRMSQSQKADAYQAIERLMMVGGGVMLLVFIVLFWGAEPIAALLGKGYAGMGDLAKIMAIVPLFVTLGGIVGQVGLLACGEESDKRVYRNIYLLAAVCSLLLVGVCVPTWHSEGAAWALLITEGGVCVAMLLAYKRMKKR